MPSFFEMPHKHNVYGAFQVVPFKNRFAAVTKRTAEALLPEFKQRFGAGSSFQPGPKL
jgi:hypothetical protein